MSSYLSAFCIRTRGADGVVFREMNPNEFGETHYRLAIKPHATVQHRIRDPKSGELVWTDLQTYDDLELAAMLAFDSCLHSAPMTELWDRIVVEAPSPDLAEHPNHGEK
jgi:hypothetical protein